MTKYKKKPIIVDAIQWDGTNNKDIYDFGEDRVAIYGNTIAITDETKNYVMTAKIGDWIIKGLDGEIYPCENARFNEIYERVG